MGLRPTQGDEKRLLLSGTAIPPPCHPDRSAAQWRDLRFSQDIRVVTTEKLLIRGQT